MSDTEKYTHNAEIRRENSSSNELKQKETIEAWKQRAYAVGTTKEGQTVVFDRPSTIGATRPNWNPDVRPGQTISGAVPRIIANDFDKAGTNQLVALKDAAMMNRIQSFIAKTYGEGVGKDISHLTPREAVDLARRILAERTQYNSSVKNETISSLKKGASIIGNKDEISIEEYKRTQLAKRHSVDRRDVESLLKDPDDLDVICRNQAEAFIVIHEAIKRLQDPEVSLLNTSYARLTQEMGVSSRVGYMPDGQKVVRLPNEKGLFVINGVMEEEIQQSVGVHEFSKGSIRRLTMAEEEKIQYTTNNELFADPTKSIGHMIVECITQDRKGRFHVLPLNTTDESTNAEFSGAELLNESIFSWNRDFSRNELRRIYDQILESGDAESIRMITANYPLLITYDAQESKRRLTWEEIQWFKTYANSIKERVASSWNYTTVYDQLFLTNTVAALIDDGSLDEAEAILQIGKETEWQWKRGMKDLSVFRTEYEHLQKVIDQQRGK